LLFYIRLGYDHELLSNSFVSQCLLVVSPNPNE
jgi:hypothetical protein